MAADVQMLTLEPADLTVEPPPWETGIGAATVGIAVIAGAAEAWNATADKAPAALTDLLAAPVLTLGVLREGELVAASERLFEGCDLVVRPEDGADAATRGEELAALAAAAGAPGLVAAQLLRDAGIGIESFAFSMLLAGPDFRDWRSTVDPELAADADRSRVEVSDAGEAWAVVLSRPGRHNAFDARMREELCDALDAIAAQSPRPVMLFGAGSSFCSGGDLDEFGSATDPVLAHIVRGNRSVGRRLRRLQRRLVAGVHGHCIGAGLELASFAGTLVAATTASFALPEMSVGLNLGAGGALSIPGRVGRHRTLELLMRPGSIDAETALGWGLVDEIVAPETVRPRCAEIAAELATEAPA